MGPLKAQIAGWGDKQFIPHPSTWLNQKRWEDEIENEDVINKPYDWNETHGL